MLVVIGGLPGVGKTSIARELARRTGAVYLRIDSIEQALRDSGAVRRSLDDAGYRAAYAAAADNLALGLTVIADSVNPLQLTRDAWVQVAQRARVNVIEVEVQCSSTREHRRRVERRHSGIPGLKLPTWEDVVTREYHPWQRERLVIDTAVRTGEECVAVLCAAVAASRARVATDPAVESKQQK